MHYQLNPAMGHTGFPEKHLGFYKDLTVISTEGCDDPFHYPTAIGQECYSLILLTKGMLNLYIGEGELKLKERDIILIFPETAHKFSSSQGAAYIRIDFKREYLKKQGIFLGNAHAYRIFRHRAVHRFSLTDDEFNGLYWDMLALEKKLRISNEIPYAADIIRNSFIEILYDLFLVNNFRASFEPPRHDSKFELTTRFFNLLTKNFRKEKRVNYYAGELCVTPRYLSQVLKEVTYKTAGELVDEIVIKEAKILLTGQNMNISEVAMKLYFSDVSFFGKYFKKKTGISPSRYKVSSKIAV